MDCSTRPSTSDKGALMATSEKQRLTDLTGDELTKLLALVGGSDSVELKLTIPEQQQRSTLATLEVDPLEAQIRQVFFFDTPDLALNRSGVAVRARRVQGRTGDTVVKLRPIAPDSLPDDVRHSASVNVEVDAMPGGYVCSASMKGQAPNADVREAILGRSPVRKLFSKEQRDFFTAHAPEGIGLDDLSILGPIFVLKLKETASGHKRKLVVELWLYPDGSRILELSTRCLPGEAFQAGVEARAYLTGLGLDLSAEQQTKTKTALEFFAAELHD
jgi:hypothetical protein